MLLLPNAAVFTNHVALDKKWAIFPLGHGHGGPARPLCEMAVSRPLIVLARGQVRQ